VTIKGESFSTRLFSDMAAVYRISDRYGQLYAVSLAGAEREIQAISAGLADASMSFSWDVSDTALARAGARTAGARWLNPVMPAQGGFNVRKAKLDPRYDTWHMVAVSKSPNFMLHGTDEALWKIIRSDKFTTPLLRSWCPVIRESLHKMGYLVKCDFFGQCFDKGGPPSYLLATDATLDKVVSDGVKYGNMVIQPAAEAA